MAIKGFKDIIDRKGYKVDSEDRKVFEKEISKSNLGLGCSDMIEFILFDSSENQLPQGDDGKLVRYIYIDDVNVVFCPRRVEIKRRQCLLARCRT